MARAARVLPIETGATACLVDLKNMRFEDANNFAMDYTMLFNGVADNYSGEITFARNASTAAKTTQIRQLVNAVLAGLETNAAPINSANIQISGLPV